LLLNVFTSTGRTAKWADGDVAEAVLEAEDDEDEAAEEDREGGA